MASKAERKNNRTVTARRGRVDKDSGVDPIFSYSGGLYADVLHEGRTIKFRTDDPAFFEKVREVGCEDFVSELAERFPDGRWPSLVEALAASVPAAEDDGEAA